MKLYIVNDDDLKFFELTESTSENVLFSYIPKSTNIEVFLNIVSVNNEWYLKSDDTLSVDGGADFTLLKYYNSYSLKIKGIDTPVNLYVLPISSTDYSMITINDNLENISVGKSTTTIKVNSDDFLDEEVSFKNINGIWKLYVSEESMVFVNNKKIEYEYALQVGDVIFIKGLKLIWMKRFMKVIYLKNKIEFSNNITFYEKEIFNNNMNIIRDDVENNISLYGEDDLFFRKPRLYMASGKEQVKVDLPPATEIKEEVPFILSLGGSLTMLIFAVINISRAVNNYSNGNSSKFDFTTQIILSSAMIIGSFLIPRLTNLYQKKHALKKEETRKKKYNDYLDKKQKEIGVILKKQSQDLYDVNLSTKECYEDILGKRFRLWERVVTDDDFLTVRIGTGDREANIDINSVEERFVLDHDELVTRAHSLINYSKTLVNVPITFSFLDNMISSIVCNHTFSQKYVDGLLIQLMAMHSPADLKFVILTSEENESRWDYLRLSSYCSDETKSFRYFATNDDEAKKVIQNIENIYNERKENIENYDNDINNGIDKDKEYVNLSPYYLIITDNYRKYKDMKFINDFLKFDTNLGYSLLLVEKSMKNLPNECNKFVYVVDKTSCIFEKRYASENQINFITEYEEDIDVYKVIRTLSNIPIQSNKEMNSLPQTLSFLDMYNVGKIEQLNVASRWKNSNPIITLQAPIGVQTNGEVFKLDLHEKTHGPHGLIAGSTGSGKSEFIITYILSMALNYHPDEVKFVLIDYKGGGLTGAFENREKGIAIPHLAGTITNLDTAEMNRTLVSIESELKRRQQLFNELRDNLGEGTIDIYKYQRYYREGLAKEPIPHLFIISDEFAELKAQQPDFMDELISTSRIGRSLGVHLILATQKPSGVVNDQIWSNSRFRICLKVQTRSDSNEMIKKPDAASIKEAGRFYLQVGYDELFELGQSAWSGARYIPADKVIKKIDDSVMFINNCGDVINSSNNLITKETKEDKGDQLTNIVSYLHNLAIQNNIKFSRLWLNSIPPEIYISDLQVKYNYNPEPYIINPIVGEYDAPSLQKQGLATVNFSKDGNLIIYGLQGSGKENLIMTIIVSSCLYHSTSEVNFYILDYGSESLRMLKDLQHVGDIIFADEEEKLNNFVSTLRGEIEKRKELFSNYMGDYLTYIKESGEKIPLIVCVINQFDNFTELYPNISESFISIFKESMKYGIVFVITTNSSSVRTRIAQSFNNKIALQLADPNDYRFILGAPKELIPAKEFGRGVIKLDESYEFQTAFITNRENIKEAVKSLIDKLKQMYPKKAPAISVLPEHILSKGLYDKITDLKQVPIGINKSKLDVCYYDFLKHNITPIICSNVEANMSFIYGLVDILKRINNVKVRVIDVLKLFNKSLGVDVFNEDYNTLIKQIKIELNKDKQLKKTSLFIIIGLSEFKNKLDDDTKGMLTSVFEHIPSTVNNKFIIFDNYTSYKFLENESWFHLAISNSNGIWIGENVSTQLAIRIGNLEMKDKKILFNDIAYKVTDSNYKVFKHVTDEVSDGE